MFFFDDNAWMFRKRDLVGERLGKFVREHGILIMACVQCANIRSLTKKVLDSMILLI